MQTFDKQKAFEVLKMDKKRERKEMNYVLLEKIGKGVVKSIPLKQLGRNYSRNCKVKVTIQPSQLKGTIQAPASKSSMQRACAAAY